MNLEKNNLIRLEEVCLGIDEDEAIMKARAAFILDLAEGDIISCAIVKKNIDSRQKNILFVYTLDVKVKDVKKIKNWGGKHRIRIHQPFVYQEKKVSPAANQSKIVITGTGPCGLFAALLLAKAGLKPLIIERGRDIDSRVRDVADFFNNRRLNPESNIQFGEGGAGTFSDGKLYTLINDPRSQYIYSELIQAGAPEEIKVDAAPHIGTDKLRSVIKNIRAKIIELGGEIRFETKLTGLEIKEGRLERIVLNDKEKIDSDSLILAIGHSARDTYQMLHDSGLKMSAKPFSIGVRIEHDAKMINKARYKASYQHHKLGTARYKLVQHLENDRPVYSFCMCPGGYVMGATSEIGGVVTNGMSEYAQDGNNSNSALLVPVTPADFNSDHPLAGIEFQRHWERKAYLAGGGNYSAPVQSVGDFLTGQSSGSMGIIKPSYLPGITPASLEECLPDYVISSLKKAIPLMDKKIPGFAGPEAVLTGVETRSSAPVRIYRNEKYESNIIGIYPAGEGAGYAGGIVSSAIDGMAIAEAVIDKINSQSLNS